MENKENNTWEYIEEEEEEVEGRLSFCNLIMQEYKDGYVLQSPRDSSAEDFFEFFNDERNREFFSAPDIIFCGKLVHEDEDDELNEYQKRDYLTMVRSHSFRRPSTYDDERDLSIVVKNSSSSRRLSANSNCQMHSVDSGYHVQKVNITSLTSMSAKSRRRMFMFGPVKFKPEMELSAIKERQGRRSPTTMFPSSTGVVDGGKAVVRSVGKAAGGGKRSRHWNMVRSSLRGRSHLTAVLARPFGCIAAASVGKWVKL